MLIFTRKVGEQIVINGNTTITVNKTTDGKVKLAIQAPEHVRIRRPEKQETQECNILETQPLENLKTCRILHVLKPNGNETDYGLGWLAKVIAASRSRIRIHAGEIFEAGTVLTIGFGKDHKLATLVYKSEKQENGSCIVEAEFNSHLTEKELQLIH